jgi:hypothetical protein
VVTLAAIGVSPTSVRGRIAWAVMVGVPIFVANRNSVVWAVLVTGVAAWAIASAVMLVADAGPPGAGDAGLDQSTR